MKPIRMNAPMSRQLAVSAALSVLAMAAFALFQGSGAEQRSAATITGAETIAAAPAFDRQLIALPRILD